MIMANFSIFGDEFFNPLQNPPPFRNLTRVLETSPTDCPARRREEKSVDINVRKRGEVQLIQLRGPLRMGPAVDGLRQTMEEALRNGDTRLVLNLAEVPMIDSSAIGLVMRILASTKQRGGNLKLVQPSKFAIQTLRLVGVLNLFEVFDNDDAAVESYA